MAHWTEKNYEAFTHKIAFDFIAQIEKQIEKKQLSQKQLAHELGVSEGAVSKVLNNPQNLTLKTIAKYSQALGVKAAIVAYDDNDPKNEKGLVASQIFATCWEFAGKPRDVWALEVNQSQQSATTDVVHVVWEPMMVGYYGNYSFVGNNSFVGLPSPIQGVYVANAFGQNWSNAPNITTAPLMGEDVGVEHHA
jgi:transcriptional regulator with XRE-family HTH domain